MTTTAATRPAPQAPVTAWPRTAPELRAAVRDLIARLHQLEAQALGTTGRRYRELSDEMNALEQLAIDYTQLATRLEQRAEVRS